MSFWDLFRKSRHKLPTACPEPLRKLLLVGGANWTRFVHVTWQSCQRGVVWYAIWRTYVELVLPGIKSKRHVVRLLTYQPGQLLNKVPCTQNLMSKVGKFVGRMDNVLKVSLTNASYTSHLNVADQCFSRNPELIAFIYITRRSPYTKLEQSKFEGL